METIFNVNSIPQGPKYSNIEESGNWYPDYDNDADNGVFYVPPSYDGEIEASERESSTVEVALQTSRSRYRVLCLYFLSSLFQFYLISSLNPLTRTNATPVRFFMSLNSLENTQMRNSQSISRN